jgi:hypothetical protein
MTHTYNGEPIGCVWCEAGYVPVVSSLDPEGKIFVHPDLADGRVVCKSPRPVSKDDLLAAARRNPMFVREALRFALELIDELQDGNKGAWTVEDVNRLAEWRALARE